MGLRFFKRAALAILFGSGLEKFLHVRSGIKGTERRSAVIAMGSMIANSFRVFR